jgi:hypothetical protein
MANFAKNTVDNAGKNTAIYLIFPGTWAFDLTSRFLHHSFNNKKIKPN